MKIGAERKKLVFLCVLAVVGGYVFYTNVFSSSTPQPSASTARPVSPALGPLLPQLTPQLPGIPAARPGGPRKQVNRNTRGSLQDFRPPLGRKPEEGPLPTNVDPTLRLDLLSKVQSVQLEGGTRNLFQFSMPPAPPASAVKGPVIKPKTPAEIQAENLAKPVVPPGPPPPPPINLKYFGYSSLRRDGKKRAFFLDGEDIFVAAEGELIKKRYKVIRIGVNSVEVEDTQVQSKQTLPLQQETPAG